MKTNKILVMGVSGSGKSLIGHRVATALGMPFFDGDDYHPEQNVKKMRQGIPLTDQDRQGWLQTLNGLFRQHTDLVVACSALKPEYRDILRSNTDGITIIYLKGDFDTIWSRHKKRTDHYFSGEKMLISQFDTLVEPTPEEAIYIDIAKEADDVVAQILSALQGANDDQK